MTLSTTLEQFVSSVNARDWDTAQANTHEGFLFYGPAAQGIPWEMFVAMQRLLCNACPDWTFTLSDLREEEGKVIAKLGIQATQTGSLNLPIPGMTGMGPTNAKIEFPPADVEISFIDGKIAKIDASPVFKGGLGDLAKIFGGQG